MNGVSQPGKMGPPNGVRPSEQKYASSAAGSMGPPLTNGRGAGELFQKPRKLPPTEPLEPPASPFPNAGGDIENILKLMTSSTMTPLSKIGATPRTEIEVQQPNKAHVYAELPPPYLKQNKRREYRSAF